MAGKKYWDRVAGIYDIFMKKNEKPFKEVGRKITEGNWDRKAKVLELAAGTGLLTFNIASYFDDYTATDYSENMVEEMRHKAEKMGIWNLKLEMADAFDLHYEDKSFDIVIIANTLHVVDNPEKIMAEIRRVLKDDGTLIAPNFTLSGRLKEKINKTVLRISGMEVKTEWNVEGYFHFVEENGFKIMKKDIIDALFLIAYVEAEKS